jgi:HlyD family secretion protein
MSLKALDQALGFLWYYKWAALIITLMTAMIVYFGLYYFYGPHIVVDSAKRGNLVKTIVASGHYETPFRVEVSSQVTGVVAEVLVEEGQNVQAGQPLIRLDDQEARAAFVQAEGALEQAEAKMRQLNDLTLPAARELLAQSQATLLNMQAAFDRTSTLFKSGSATRASLDDAQKNLDIAKAQVHSSELQVFTASPGGSDYVVAETQINQARANLDVVKSRLSYYLIVAPRDGILISRNVEKGAVVQLGKGLLVLAPNGLNQLVVTIDEKNLGLIKLGQQAVASADAYPDQKFNAHVSYINPGIDMTRASIEIKLDILDPPTFLRQDMTISVDIQVERRDDILILPVRSVHDLQTEAPWVLTYANGRAVKRDIKVGVKGLNYVEIVSGLTEGDLTIPSLSGVLSGQHIRPLQL